MRAPTATRLVCLLVAALIATKVSPNAASAQTLFSEVSAYWKGRGTFQTDPHRPVRHAWCRVRVTPSPTAITVTVKARCGSGILSTRFTMQIETRRGSIIAAGVTSPLLPKVVQYVGTSTGGKIQFNAVEPVDLGRHKYHSEFAISLSRDDSLKIEETVWPINGSKRQKIVDITFQPYTPWFAALK